MAFAFRRSRGGPDPYLYFKYLGFVIGAAAALAGIAFNVGWLINAAIAIMLVVLVGTRFARRREPPHED